MSSHISIACCCCCCCCCYCCVGVSLPLCTGGWTCSGSSAHSMPQVCSLATSQTCAITVKYVMDVFTCDTSKNRLLIGGAHEFELLLRSSVSPDRTCSWKMSWKTLDLRTGKNSFCSINWCRRRLALVRPARSQIRCLHTCRAATTAVESGARCQHPNTHTHTHPLCFWLRCAPRVPSHAHHTAPHPTAGLSKAPDDAVPQVALACTRFSHS